MIAVSYNRAGFAKEFAGVLRQAQRPEAVLMAAGRELSNQLRSHFRKKDREEPNKLSPRREHFWLQVMRSVHNPEQTGYNTVSVRVSDPRIAQKVFGGRIVAKRARALTIPVAEKAYGRTASTFERETGLKLFLLIPTDGGKAEGKLAAKIGEQVEVQYVLRRSVNQKSDPTALPDKTALEKAILERARKVAERQKL